MAVLVLYSFAVFGSAWVLGLSKISYVLYRRPIFVVCVKGQSNPLSLFFGLVLEMIECPACLSAWLGAFAWWKIIRLPEMLGHAWSPLVSFVAQVSFSVGAVLGLASFFLGEHEEHPAKAEA